MIISLGLLSTYDITSSTDPLLVLGVMGEKVKLNCHKCQKQGVTGVNGMGNVDRYAVYKFGTF